MLVLNDVVITGNTGFIGNHLTTLLSDKKFKILGISNKKSKNKNIKQITKDLHNIKNSDIPKNSTIIHLAAVSDISFCQENPVACFKTNVLGTQHLLEISRNRNCNFLFVSSSHVYGSPDKLPLKENSSLNPSNIYAASKVSGESLCNAYRESYGMKTIVARLFSVYGPNSPPHLMINNLATQIISKNTVKLGNLFPKRDFIFVEDVVSAIYFLLKKQKSGIFNIGTGKSTSILEICKTFENFSQKPIQIKQNPKLVRKNDIPEIRSDISKMKKLGWKPKFTLYQGLKNTFDWYNSKFLN